MVTFLYVFEKENFEVNFKILQMKIGCPLFKFFMKINIYELKKTI